MTSEYVFIVIYPEILHNYKGPLTISIDELSIFNTINRIYKEKIVCFCNPRTPAVSGAEENFELDV